jgi:hypothetical protein
MFVLYFFILHGMIHTLGSCFNKTYQGLDSKKKIEYRSYVVAPFHHCVSIFAAILTMFYVCGDGDNVFNNLECMDTPRNLHMLCMVHSCGYFIVDTIFMIMTGEKSTQATQLYAHHFISIVNFYGTLVYMNFTVTFGVLMLFTEISTIFICIRWFLYTHGQGHSCFAVVNTCFVFISFALFRVTF